MYVCGGPQCFPQLLLAVPGPNPHPGTQILPGDSITFAGDKSSQPLPGMVHKFTAVPGTLLGRCEF